MRIGDSHRSRPPLKVVDVFVGAGGISEGFRQAGFEIVAGSDIDPDALATFAKNFPNAQVIGGNLCEATVRERVVDVARSAEVLVGGPPCQAFSQMQNHSRLIDDPRNSLYREFVQIVRETSPKAFVMENVTGMDQMGVREQIRRDLSLEGEYVVRAQVLDAADFGVPQTRKRLIFSGLHHSFGDSVPELQGTEATTHLALSRSTIRGVTNYEVVAQIAEGAARFLAALADEEDLSIVNVHDALSDLTPLQPGRRSDTIEYSVLGAPRSAYQRQLREDAARVLTNVQVPRINADTAMRLEAIPEGGNYRDLRGVLTERYITGHRWGQDNGSGLLSRRHFYAYRRLHRAMWAWTLNTKADSAYHYASSRSLSVREFARLQSFPDRFVFTTDPRRGALPGRHDGGPAHSRYRQVGNAVPPFLARAIAMNLRTAIHETIDRTPTLARTA